MSKFVKAYSTRTGRKLADPVPEHYFDHPVIGKSVRRTPRSAAQKRGKAAAERASDQVESDT